MALMEVWTISYDDAVRASGLTLGREHQRRVREQLQSEGLCLPIPMQVLKLLANNHTYT